MNQIQKCNPFKRLYVLQMLTNHLGHVEEYEDKIICYVKPSILKNQPSYLEIKCPSISECEEKTGYSFHLNKPIYYVIQNMKFLSSTLILGSRNENIHVLIKNCEFPLGVHIIGFDQCVIKDSSINPSFKYFLISTGRLKIENVKINPLELFPSLNSSVKIDANEIYLKSSYIGKENENKLNVNINANAKCVLFHSQIYGKKIEFSTPHINLQNSCLQEKENIQIHTNKLVYSKKK